MTQRRSYLECMPALWHIPALVILTLLMSLPGLSSIPAIDRDEARYLQSSAQMAESGDWLNIRFQEEARNKKPAGAYWAQTAMIELTGGPPQQGLDRKIWAQRLPSVIAGILAVLLTYWAAVPMAGRRSALIAGALLSTSLIFVFEAHIAKTDALLLASTTGMLCALARLRAGEPGYMTWLFWIALGLSIFIKGPIGPTLAIASLAGLLIWERTLSWAKPLLRPLPIFAFFLIWLPWAIAIYFATDGAFFAESLGNDFGGKLISVQERHPGPPGYHLLLSTLTLWPASLFLLPAITFGWHVFRKERDSDFYRHLKLIAMWVIPFWLMIEFMPTKLPHYSLPLFPAICILIAVMLKAVPDGFVPKWSRWIGAGLFFLGSLTLIAVIIMAQLQYGRPSGLSIAVISTGLAAVFGLVGVVSWLKNRAQLSLVATLLSALILSVSTYGVLLPNLDNLWVGRDIARFAQDRTVYSMHFTEPSLVYHSGTDTVLAPQVDWEDLESWRSGLLVIDRMQDETIETAIRGLAGTRDICIREDRILRGTNYSKGDTVELVLLSQVPCGLTDITEN